VKEMTATQLFARLPNYIPDKTEKKDKKDKKDKTPEPLVGLKGCSLFRKVKKPKSDLTPAEKRAAKTLASLEVEIHTPVEGDLLGLPGDGDFALR
tara:strand:+ start:480 stop:764 length:285 start_codon:yes stop_codon:yes gene_type:complete